MSKNLMAIGSLGKVLLAALILGGIAHAGTICESTNRREACGENGAGHKLSPSEVKSLLKSASMPEDHWQLAAHFREEAAQEDETAAWYESTASCTDPKSHCSYLANNARKASKHDMKMAEEQDRIAEAMLNNTAGGLIHGR
jgi:hypothetical protein